MDYRLRTARVATACALAVAVSALSAQTSDRARTEAQARRVSERLRTLQHEADELATQERTLLTDLRRLEVERSLKNEQVCRQRRAPSRRRASLGRSATRSMRSSPRRRKRGRRSKRAWFELYKLGSAGYVRMLMTVSDLKELGRAYRMVSALAALDRQRAEQHQQNLAALKKARAALEQRSAEMAQQQRQAVAARAEAARAAVARERLIAGIDARRDLTAQLAGELLAAQQRLQQTLGSISSGTPRAESELAPLPIRPFRGDLDWPVTGRVFTRFNSQGSAGAGATPQSGIQISAPEGTVVRAVHDGTVAFAGPFTGYGNLVIVDHGGNTYSLYGQLDGVSVARGAKVDRGQTLGTTGRVLLGVPGTYFEMRVDGKPVDPLEWLKKR
jgi:septal ring factor EnvC (AmiA/AmiB activator)